MGDASRRRLRLTLFGAGAACIVAGILVIAIPLVQVYTRGHRDTDALKTWDSGGASAMVGPLRGSHTGACGSTTTADYALVSFPSLPDGYAGVAGNGSWDLLDQRSMVHYTTSAAPGGQGNVIIAFHREPDFQHIDQLKKGDLVSVQDQTCHTFQYRITQEWDLDPRKVDQLGQTTGHELTLITCTPWFQDYRRLVWRAELVTPGV